MKTKSLMPVKFKINKKFVYVRLPIETKDYLNLNEDSDLHCVALNGQMVLASGQPICTIPFLQDKPDLFIPQK